MVYRSTESDPDVWIKSETIENFAAYYKYMLVYADYVLHVAKDAQEDMLKINPFYRLQEGLDTPDRYLGANFDKVQFEYGRKIQSMLWV